MSPEVIENSSVTTKSDIWSLGITSIELVTGKPPLYGTHSMRIMFLIPKNEPPRLEGQFTKLFKDFVSQCLRKKPEERLNAFDLLQHEFIVKAKSTSELAPIVEEYNQYKMKIEREEINETINKMKKVILSV
jgi:serine/threonine-protein kinase 24/25/MST4